MNGTPQQIAQTILEQLGGNKFLAMTGARDLLYGGEYHLQFRLPRGAAKNKATNVTVKLIGDEHYELMFYKVHRFNITQISKFETIPENMRETFTRETGLHCTLGTMKG